MQGPGYWSYATRYSVYAITSLKTALGDDQGLGNSTGFDRSAEFEIQQTGPSMQIFNWADSHASHGSSAKPSDTPEMFYLASQYDHPDAAFFERFKISEGARSTTDDIINFAASGSSADVMKLPLCQFYPRRNVIVSRSAWLDPMAAYVGFKGGNVSYPHSHMDLGSFVFESNGQRWAIDLGADSYALPEYFGKKRYTYYRLRNIGHNTLAFDDDNMGERSASKLTDVTCSENGREMSATAQLTEAFAPSKVKSVSRQLTFSQSKKSISIVDKIDIGESNAESVTWSWHTYADIKISAGTDSAQLVQDGQSISVAVNKDETKCPGLVMSSESINLPPPQDPSTGISKLFLKASTKACSVISVDVHY